MAQSAVIFTGPMNFHFYSELREVGEKHPSTGIHLELVGCANAKRSHSVGAAAQIMEMYLAPAQLQ